MSEYINELDWVLYGIRQLIRWREICTHVQLVIEHTYRYGRFLVTVVSSVVHKSQFEVKSIPIMETSFEVVL